MSVKHAARHVHVLRGLAFGVSEKDRELFDAALLCATIRKLDELLCTALSSFLVNLREIANVLKTDVLDSSARRLTNGFLETIKPANRNNSRNEIKLKS